MDSRIIDLLTAIERFMHYRRESARLEAWGERLDFERLDKDDDEELNYNSAYDSIQQSLEQAEADYDKARAAVMEMELMPPVELIESILPPN